MSGCLDWAGTSGWQQLVYNVCLLKLACFQRLGYRFAAGTVLTLSTLHSGASGADGTAPVAQPHRYSERDGSDRTAPWPADRPTDRPTDRASERSSSLGVKINVM